MTDVREVEKMGGDIQEVTLDEGDHKLLRDLMNVHLQMNSKNYVEFYHDSIEYRDELFTLFGLGYLSLEARAKAEVIVNEIANKALHYHALSGVQLEEFEELSKSRTSKYLANFSIFQSIPDSWSIEQLFPVMPLTRLNERTSKTGVIMDITCDSDGCLDKFVDKRDVKPSLELHVPQSDTPYHIGFFLVGAYQEALGNNHNLFGAVNELIVQVSGDGQLEHIEEVKGEDVGELLRVMNYTDEGILTGYAHQLNARLEEGNLSASEAEQIMAQVKGYFSEYPYLLVKSRLEIIG